MIALYAVGAAGIEQGCRADHVGAHKNLRVRDAAVHMGLRRKVNHNVRLLLLEKVKDKGSVRDIAAHKAVVLLVCDRRNALQIARIGQKIQVDDLVLRIVIDLILHEVAADKACATCHYYFHLSVLSAPFLLYQVLAVQNVSQVLAVLVLPHGLCRFRELLAGNPAV